VDYVYFTRYDRFLGSVRSEPRFQALMAAARERYERFTDERSQATRVEIAG
jgi:hypothetical protein